MKTELIEDFTDNHRGWYEYGGTDNTIQVRDGQYIFSTPEGGWLSYVQPGIETSRPFSMEATFTQTNGNSNNGFGFIWGYNATTKELNNFVISTNGYVKVWSSDVTRADAKDWVEHKSVKPLGQPNTLRMVHQNGELSFYVNGSFIKKIKSLPWFSPSIGFVTYTQMTMFVDNFALRYDTRIPLPPDLKVTGLKKENLGAEVNTAYNEVTPKISVDGKLIFFTRKYAPQNLGGVADASDVWTSAMENGNWTISANLNTPVNSASVNNITSVGQDNNSLLLATSHDFEMFERTFNGWSSAGTLGIYYENEHEYFEASLSADGRALVFTARNRLNLFYSENLPEKDVYVVLKYEDGRWGSPINLGPSVNTRGSETSPFLAADGKTLYYATDGLPGYGQMDIFMTRRLDDSWTRWSAPVNLGSEINSFGFDAYYTLPASGDFAYMCTNSGGYGLSDIVRIRLPESLKPNPVALVMGRVLNARTGKPVEADIVFENLTSGKKSGEAISNPASGSYRVALPYGVNYGLHAQAKGYLSVNENIELSAIRAYTEIQKDLLLVPIQVGEAIQLNNVFFEQGRPLLKPESYPELDRLVQIMRDNPTLEIDLGGHTDNVGNPASLQVLSQERVGTVKNYLVKQGISGSRITGRGYGPSKPLVKNDTEEHRRMNRRVEFTITKK